MEADLLSLIERLWKEPPKEIIIVYHPEGSYLFKIHTFENLLKSLGIRLKDQEVYSHPAVIFACLATASGAINYDRYYNNTEVIHDLLMINKISINKYQEWTVKNKEVLLKLKLPEMVIPDTFKDYKFEELNTSRPPQLRRILKYYYKLLDINFDEALLAQKLYKLSAHNDDYSYEDSDEIILSDDILCEDTYLEWLPRELRKEIIDVISNYEYLTEKDLSTSDNPIINMVEKITDTIKSQEDASVMDIVGKLHENGNLLEMVKYINRDPNNGGDLYKYISTKFGMGNLVDIIKKKNNSD